MKKGTRLNSTSSDIRNYTVLIARERMAAGNV